MHVPSHISRASDNLVVVEESTTGQVSIVAREFPADPHISLPRLEAVDGTDIVETSAGHIATRWGVGTGHHPAGSQWYGMHLQNNPFHHFCTSRTHKSAKPGMHIMWGPRGSLVDLMPFVRRVVGSNPTLAST